MYYYKSQDEKGTLKSYKEVFSDNWIQISKEEYENIPKHEVQPYTPSVEKMTIMSQIQQLKLALANLDYKTIKYVEGALSEEEFTQVKQEKQNLRNKINELEEELK